MQKLNYISNYLYNLDYNFQITIQEFLIVLEINSELIKNHLKRL